MSDRIRFVGPSSTLVRALIATLNVGGNRDSFFAKAEELGVPESHKRAAGELITRTESAPMTVINNTVTVDAEGSLPKVTPRPPVSLSLEPDVPAVPSLSTILDLTLDVKIAKDPGAFFFKVGEEKGEKVFLATTGIRRGSQLEVNWNGKRDVGPFADDAGTIRDDDGSWFRNRKLVASRDFNGNDTHYAVWLWALRFEEGRSFTFWSHHKGRDSRGNTVKRDVKRLRVTLDSAQESGFRIESVPV